MKKVLLISCLLVAGIIANAQKPTYYGNEFDAKNAISISEAITTIEKAEQASINETKIKGTIINTCAKKGCWMNITDDNGNQVRVTFKDYGFFVPTSGVENATVTVIGTLKKETTDIATLKHFAEDAGKTPEEIALIKEPKTEYTFEATGVLIQ